MNGQCVRLMIIIKRNILFKKIAHILFQEKQIEKPRIGHHSISKFKNKNLVTDIKNTTQIVLSTTPPVITESMITSLIDEGRWHEALNAIDNYKDKEINKKSIAILNM